MDRELQEIKDLLHKLDKRLAIQNTILEEHIKRTEIAEKNLELLEARINPLQELVFRLDGVYKFIGLLATVASIASVVIAVLQ